VKVGKPSINVDAFKAILSEVKLMIYVGGTPNVVRLLGVCTQDIRSRNVRLIFELCENGSLISYLRNNKANYIDLSLETGIPAIPQIQACFSIMDLLRWSAEIANGMDHLGIKKVRLLLC
jgi:serine/threonine protein kinase